MLKYLQSVGGHGQVRWNPVKNALIKPEHLLDAHSSAKLSRWYWYPMSALTPTELAAVKKHLTVTPEQRQYATKQKQPVSFPVWLTNATSIGVPPFYGRARWGVAAQDDTTTGQPMRQGIKFAGTLLPGQVEATKDVLCCLKRHGGALLVKDCGLGKTVDGCYVAVQLGVRTGVLVHDEDLMKQWRKHIGKWFPAARVGIVQQDTVECDNVDFIIFMVQSVYGRAKRGNGYPASVFDSVGLLIVDEAHHIGSRMFCQVVSQFRARYRLAMTATPTRKDRQAHLISWFMGPLAHLKERDTQLPVTVVIHKYTGGCQKEIVYRNGIVAKFKMVERMFKDAIRNQSILERLVTRVEEGRKILVLCGYHCGLNTIHGMLKQRLPDVDARFYTGKVKRNERESALDGQVIFATTNKGDEALDCPALDTLFRISPASESKQPVGRILRDHPTKKLPVVEHWYDPFSIFEGMFWNCQRYYTKKKYKLEWMTVVDDKDSIDTQDSDDDFTFF